ncbi:cell division protein PerM, partial [Kitasatospora nipponensis]|uniref:cell division protein PerM n=1 Tax=Kitasatospora nipponensis TaxID=258049 RepID=UPI0031D96DE7
MTHHLMDRPILRGVGAPASGPVLAGATAALLGLALTAVPVLVLWVLSAAPQDSASDAARLAGGLWLLAHGGPLTRGGATTPLSLTPLLLTLALVHLLRRAAARAARVAGARVSGVPAGICAGYLAVALPVALACTPTGALRAEPLPDLLAIALVGYGAAALGAGSGPRWWPGVRNRIARWGRGRAGHWTPWAGAGAPQGGAAELLRAAAGALLTLTAGAAVLFTGALLLHAGPTGRQVQTLTGGSVPGTLCLLLTCLLLVPNAVLWSAAYALGPGFQLGTGTVVAPGHLVTGALPDFPLLALAPGTASGWQRVVLLLPLLAGAVAAVLLGRAAGRAPLPWP